MAGHQSVGRYRLNLKEGDHIHATISSVGTDGPLIDTSPWANIDVGVLVEVGENTQITPGSDIHAKVADIEDGSARLKQQRGIYRRNHLPGDALHVTGIEQVGSNLCRADPGEMRNLESLLVIGVGIGADVTVRLEKIRSGTGVAQPIEVHDAGLVAERTITVNTTAGSREATVSSIPEHDAVDGSPPSNTSIELAAPARAYGTATAKVTDVSADGITGALEGYPIKLPVVDDTLQATLPKGQIRRKVSWCDADVAIDVEFDHPVPATGTARLVLTGEEAGRYNAEIVEYVDPEIRIDRRYEATVYKTNNRAKIGIGDREITVALIDDISTTGQATVRITEISDSIKGQIEGEIGQMSIDRTESDDVDMTNLSKF